MLAKLASLSKWRLILAATVTVFAVCLPFIVHAAEGDGAVSYESPLYGTFWSLVPPLIAIILALITKEVFSSLFIGVLIGGIFFASGSNPAVYDEAGEAV
jgi:uncharacterized membrane protein YccC